MPLIRNLLTLSLLGLFVVACDSEDKPDDTSSPDDTAEGDADVDADGDADTDGESPWLETADAYCYQHKTGDKFWLWEINCTADDPQGADTISSFDKENNIVSVLSSAGGELAAYALVCDDSGSCFGSFKESEDGIACANATTYTFRFQVVDEDGNVSDPLDVQGRQQ